eukprot:TCONS_00068137-protein
MANASKTDDAPEKLMKMISIKTEFQNITSLALDNIALQHNDSTSKNPKEALAQILSAHKDALEKLPCVKSMPVNKKFFYDDNGVIHKQVVTERLDCTLLVSLIKDIDGLTPFSVAQGACVDSQHKACKHAKDKSKHRCVDLKAKNLKVDHVGWFKYGRDLHRCSYCKKNEVKSQYSCCLCCSLCNTCGSCNNQLDLQKQCMTFRLVRGLDDIHTIRNVVSHITVQKLEAFLKGKELLDALPEVKTWQEFTDRCKIAYMNIVNFLKMMKYANDPQEQVNFSTRYEYRMDAIIVNSNNDVIKSYHKSIYEHFQNESSAQDIKGDLKTLLEMVKGLQIGPNLQEPSAKIKIEGAGGDQAIKQYIKKGKPEEQHNKPDHLRRQTSFAEVSNLAYYYKDIKDAGEAERFLNNKPPGSYIIRVSGKAEKMHSLSINAAEDEDYRHYRLLVDRYGQWSFENNFVEGSFPIFEDAISTFEKRFEEVEQVKPVPIFMKKSASPRNSPSDYPLSNSNHGVNSTSESEGGSELNSAAASKNPTPSEDGVGYAITEKEEDNATELSYFYPNIDRQKAEEMLAKENPGAYLLRSSSKFPDGYVLSFRKEHLNIRPKEGSIGKYIFDKSQTGLIFNTVRGAINHYVKRWGERNGTQPFPLTKDS